MGLYLFFASFVIFAGLFWGLKLYTHFSPTSFLQHQEKTIFNVLGASCLVGGTLLSVFSPVFPIFLFVTVSGFVGLGLEYFSLSKIWKNIFCCLISLGGFLILYKLDIDISLILSPSFLLTYLGVCVLAIAASPISKKWKLIFSFLLCLGGSFLLVQNSIVMPLFMALAWFGLWSLFVWFDRFPFVSFLTSVSWVVALFSIGLVIQTVPYFALYSVSLIGAIVIAIGYFQLSQKQLVLGRLTASLVGFIFGAIWSYFLITGAVFQVATAFGYYLFEGVVLGIAFYTHRPLQTYLTGMLARPDLAPKSVKVVFSHLLILSFLSAMTLHLKWSVSPILIFPLGIILVDLYLRLNALIHPQPTWGELLKNAKESFSLLSKKTQKKSSSPKDTCPKKTQKKRKSSK